MPKVDRVLPPTTDALPREPAPTIGLPDDGEYVATDEAPEVSGPVLGVTEAEMLPLTIMLLGLACKVAKGDKPNEREIALVNPPLTSVANKYNVSLGKWAPELALLGALIIVISESRMRAQAKVADVIPPSRDRSEEPLNLHTFTMPGVE